MSILLSQLQWHNYIVEAKEKKMDSLHFIDLKVKWTIFNTVSYFICAILEGRHQILRLRSPICWYHINKTKVKMMLDSK